MRPRAVSAMKMSPPGATPDLPRRLEPLGEEVHPPPSGSAGGRVGRPGDDAGVVVRRAAGERRREVLHPDETAHPRRVRAPVTERRDAGEEAPRAAVRRAWPTRTAARTCPHPGRAMPRPAGEHRRRPRARSGGASGDSGAFDALSDPRYATRSARSFGSVTFWTIGGPRDERAGVGQVLLEQRWGPGLAPAGERGRVPEVGARRLPARRRRAGSAPGPRTPRARRCGRARSAPGTPRHHGTGCPPAPPRRAAEASRARLEQRARGRVMRPRVRAEGRASGRATPA